MRQIEKEEVGEGGKTCSIRAILYILAYIISWNISSIALVCKSFCQGNALNSDLFLYFHYSFLFFFKIK
ncbi:hypothetical protein BDC45DRAFT_513416 [Circinella umbellata]|nr:hypothetical protein BDC45DRAFT_513416 [Circinella umbellata]